MKLKFKYGFTMAELLVCLAIISVIATILIPTLGQIRPDKEMTMFKKAYSVTERVVEELVNDPELYPDNDINIGFDNTGAVTYNGTTYGHGSSTLTEAELVAAMNAACQADESGDECRANKAATIRENASGFVKFCRLFAMKVNTLQDPDTILETCENAHLANPETRTTTNDQGQEETDENYSQWSHNTNNAFGGTRNDPQTEDEANSDNMDSFTTTDGIVWRMPYTNFTAQSGDNAEGNIATIWIDVNGHRKPNIADEEFNPNANPAQTCDRSLNVDRFSITVRADGKMSVNGVCAREYISEMSLMRGRGN